jgi:hypothetical protein
MPGGTTLAEARAMLIQSKDAERERGRGRPQCSENSFS